MKDEKGEVIYVGKAKVLRERVRSYFNLSDSRHSVPFILKRVQSVETLVCENERQALVLESDLIGKYKPRYNIHLKDDKSHLLVRIDMDDPWPRLELVRQYSDDHKRYIGPFVFSYEVRALLDIVNRVFPLRTCSNRVFSNRVRPCLEYQIKRCAGPCCLDVDRERYREWVEQAVALLEGKNNEVIQQLEEAMEKASQCLDFEEAAAIRDRLALLHNVRRERPTTNISSGSQDAFGFYREGSQAEITLLKVRRGRLVGSKTWGFSDVEVPDEEILSSGVSQYYAMCTDFPDEILLPLELEDREAREELYRERAGKSIVVRKPYKGPKARLLRLAESNAEENYRGRFQDESTVELRELQVLLGLEQIPRTMECADISHFQGGQTVASMVFFKDGRPQKDRYRCFTLSQQGKPDDFASMAEVVERHLSRSAEENTLSDLLIIDGGKGQLNQALQVRERLGLSRPEIVSLAKKRRDAQHYRAYLPPGAQPPTRPERVYIGGESEPIIPPHDHPSLRVLERIRNEAHRFAVSFHRSKRYKQMYKSELDGIQGVGDKRRKELLRTFGSVAAIRKATAAEIKERCQVPLKLAERILEVLNRDKVKD